MREIKPVWKTSSFLVYLGGLTVLIGGISAVGYLSTQSLDPTELLETRGW